MNLAKQIISAVRKDLKTAQKHSEKLESINAYIRECFGNSILYKERKQARQDITDTQEFITFLERNCSE